MAQGWDRPRRPRSSQPARSVTAVTGSREKGASHAGEFVAGCGPIVQDVAPSRAFWRAGLGIALQEADPQYWATETLPGVKVFALWSLSPAAESCFGTSTWPEETPPPQAWLEVDVESVAAVAAAAELQAAGHRLLRGVREEPWGQTTTRLLSPEGLRVGVTYTPVLHAPPAEEPPVAEEPPAG